MVFPPIGESVPLPPGFLTDPNSIERGNLIAKLATELPRGSGVDFSVCNSKDDALNQKPSNLENFYYFFPEDNKIYYFRGVDLAVYGKDAKPLVFEKNNLFSAKEMFFINNLCVEKDGYEKYLFVPRQNNNDSATDVAMQMIRNNKPPFILFYKNSDGTISYTKYNGKDKSGHFNGLVVDKTLSEKFYSEEKVARITKAITRIGNSIKTWWNQTAFKKWWNRKFNKAKLIENADQSTKETSTKVASTVTSLDSKASKITSNKE